MSDNLLDRAKASLEGVTEGPWETRPGATGDPTTTSASVHSGHRSILVSSDGYHYGYADKADARFIATARQLVPELIAEVEQARGWAAWFAAQSEMWQARAELHISECAAADAAAEHWKALWQGTVEDSTKVIQERDEALREVERLEAEIEGLEGMVNTMGGCLNSVAEADKLRRYR